jgi:hypothetical protein
MRGKSFEFRCDPAQTIATFGKSRVAQSQSNKKAIDGLDDGADISKNLINRKVSVKLQ